MTSAEFIVDQHPICDTCRAEGIFVKCIMANGGIKIMYLCSNDQNHNIGNRQFETPNIPKSYFSENEIAELPIYYDRRGKNGTCCYAGCENEYVENHHFAPRSIFGKDADNWPVNTLCKHHHAMWHEMIEMYYTTKNAL